MGKEVVITSAVRTAIGTFGGSLKDITPTALGSAVAKEAMSRSGIAPQEVGHVVYGHVINTEPRDMYLSRVSALDAGIPQETPAMNVNRLCGSGLQAIVSAAQTVHLGEADIALAGGAESMSRGPYISGAPRFGQKMGDVSMTDMMLGALHDPFGNGHMGVTAENVARQWQIDRSAQDEFAVRSQTRASHAIKEGYFKEQIVPVEIKVKRKPALFEEDEHVRHGASVEDMAGLRPVFEKDGTVTAGNASGINDGAGAVILMDSDKAKEKGLTPMARIIGYAHAGVDPKTMGAGPIPAVRKLLEKTDMKVGDFDVVESNEAFASQACAVSKELGFSDEQVNPNGGAIALGHPVGATGLIITVKTLYELQRIDGRYGLMTMCIGGGQGIAVAVERMQ